MLTSIQSAGVAPEVHLRITQARNHPGIHPDFETQGRHHQKSKTGMSVVPRKGIVSSKIQYKGIDSKTGDLMKIEKSETTNL